MIDSTVLGTVVDECAAWSAEFVVEGDGGGEAEEALEDALAQAGKGACSVALKGEDVLGIYLIAAQHLPYKRAAGLLLDWLGAPLSAGTLMAFVKDGSDDLDEFLDQVHQQITCSSVVHFDETGVRAGGRGRWLHSSSTQTLTFYALHDRRGTEGIDHAGVLPHF